MIRAFGRLLLTTETSIRFRVSPCDIRGGTMWRADRLSSEYSNLVLFSISVKGKLLQPGGASLVALRKHKAGSDGRSYSCRIKIFTAKALLLLFVMQPQEQNGAVNREWRTLPCPLHLLLYLSSLLNHTAVPHKTLHVVACWINISGPR